jgi:hypothetical protein
MAIIHECDNCGKQNVPGSSMTGTYLGDTTQCYVCRGDEFDPYGELEDDEPAEHEPFPSFSWHGG